MTGEQCMAGLLTIGNGETFIELLELELDQSEISLNQEKQNREMHQPSTKSNKVKVQQLTVQDKDECHGHQGRITGSGLTSYYLLGLFPVGANWQFSRANDSTR